MERDRLDRDAIWVAALDAPVAIVETKRLRRRLEHRRGHDPRLVSHLSCGDPHVLADGIARDGVEAVSLPEAIDVLVHDLDVLGRNSELLRRDGRELRLLSLRSLAEAENRHSRRMHSKEHGPVGGLISHLESFPRVWSMGGSPSLGSVAAR